MLHPISTNIFATSPELGHSQVLDLIEEIEATAIEGLGSWVRLDVHEWGSHDRDR